VTRIVADSNGRTEERAVFTKRDDRTPPESLFAPLAFDVTNGDVVMYLKPSSAGKTSVSYLQYENGKLRPKSFQDAFKDHLQSPNDQSMGATNRPRVNWLPYVIAACALVALFCFVIVWKRRR
jgi:hypothetical protein